MPVAVPSSTGPRPNDQSASVALTVRPLTTARRSNGADPASHSETMPAAVASRPGSVSALRASSSSARAPEARARG